MDSLKYICGIWDLIFVVSTTCKQPRMVRGQVLETNLGLNPFSTTFIRMNDCGALVFIYKMA